MCLVPFLLFRSVLIRFCCLPFMTSFVLRLNVKPKGVFIFCDCCISFIKVSILKAKLKGFGTLKLTTSEQGHYERDTTVILSAK